MASAELRQMLNDLGYMTVDRLKLTIKRFNQAGCRLKLAGLKAELYNRLKDEAVFRGTNYGTTSLWEEMQTIVNEVVDGNGTSPAASTSYGGVSTGGAWQQAQVNSSYPYGGPQQHHGYNNGASGSRAAPPAHQYPQQNNNIKPAVQHRPQQLPPPRFDANSGANWRQDTSVATEQHAIPIRFKPSPFYRPDTGLSGVITLARAGQGDRKSVFCNFALTEPQRQTLSLAKASPKNPQFQVRLFCTNEDFYNPSRMASAQLPAYIDFPGTCEIKINGETVNANTKGIKKQPGTAPPVDLGKPGSALSLAVEVINKIEMVYVNTEKRYFLAAYLVEVTSVAMVVERIKKAKYRSKEEVIRNIIAINTDVDVVATAYGLSLKDPLTFARIKTPIRSVNCKHIQCFDADTFFMMNEQTPTWNCPICHNVLHVEDISVDGYFDDILKTCPSSIDSVTVEPDGTWRSSDDRHGTAVSKQISNGASATSKGKGRAAEQGGADATVLLDSDDDAPEGAPRRTAISVGSSPPGTPLKKKMDVIDLTLSDSDDDDEPQLKGPYVAPPLPRPAGPGLATPRSPGTSASGTGGQAGGFTTQEMVEKGVAVAIRVAEAQEQARKRGREIDEADRAAVDELAKKRRRESDDQAADAYRRSGQAFQTFK